jgi:hypothetical protein
MWEFVVDNVALGQVSLLVLQLFPVNIIPPLLFFLIYLAGEQGPLVAALRKHRLTPSALTTATY